MKHLRNQNNFFEQSSFEQIHTPYYTLHKKIKFPTRGFFGKCDQSAGNCKFGHVYRRIL